MDREKLKERFRRNKLSGSYVHILIDRESLLDEIERILADETQGLYNVLKAAYQAIEVAIYNEDGMDGFDGEVILKQIERVHPKGKALSTAPKEAV